MTNRIQCPKCSALVGADNFDNHYLQKHILVPFCEKYVSSKKCSKCSKKFSTHAQLAKHFRERHPAGITVPARVQAFIDERLPNDNSLPQNITAEVNNICRRFFKVSANGATPSQTQAPNTTSSTTSAPPQPESNQEPEQEPESESDEEATIVGEMNVDEENTIDRDDPVFQYLPSRARIFLESQEREVLNALIDIRLHGERPIVLTFRKPSIEMDDIEPEKLTCDAEDEDILADIQDMTVTICENRENINVQIYPICTNDEVMEVLDNMNVEFDEEDTGLILRTGISGTFHRVSFCGLQRNPLLTIRIGKALSGVSAPFDDLIQEFKSVLIIGSAGLGKTSLLRDVARKCSSEMNLTTVVVDTHAEIGQNGKPSAITGDAEIVVPKDPSRQPELLTHIASTATPQAIICDEIINKNEADSTIMASNMCGGNVIIWAATHGNLPDVIASRTRNSLLGGSQTVILGDSEAGNRNLDHKTVSERIDRPVFDSCVEIVSFNVFNIHHDLTLAVDSIKRRQKFSYERVTVDEEGQIRRQKKIWQPEANKFNAITVDRRQRRR